MTQRRVIIVTGAGSGIGAATARCLAAPGVALVLHTRGNRAGLDSLCRELQVTGAETEAVLGDLADPATATDIIAAATDRFGQLDVLVSNAGFANRTGTAALTDAALAQSWEAIGAGLRVRLFPRCKPLGRAGSSPSPASLRMYFART